MIPTIFLISIIFLVGFSRHLAIDYPTLLNFSPVIAIFWFCGSYLRGSISWIAPIVSIFISDLLLNPFYGRNLLEPFMLTTIISYVLIWWLGKRIGDSRSLAFWTSGALFSALLFHIITCSFSWIANPAYPKTIAGFFQAIIIGEPGFAPSYLFLRNSLLGTLFFSLCLRFMQWFIHSPSSKKEGATVKRVSQT